MWLELLHYAGYDVIWILTGEERSESVQSDQNVDVPIYDQCETYENCTVQVLTNTLTGETSVGWWQNEMEECDECM